MVRNVHTDSIDRPCEEAALDRAMSSIDPLLQVSLKRDQMRRRRKYFLGAILMMTTLTGMLVFLMMSLGGMNNIIGFQQTQADDDIENAAKAEELSKEAWQLWHKRDWPAAEKKFAAAYKLDPESESTLNGYGWSLIHQGRHKEALDKFRSCLELNNDHGGAINGAGQCSLALGEIDRAERYFKRSGEHGSAALVTLARIQLVKGKFDEAKLTLEKLEKTGDMKGDSLTLLNEMKDAAEAEEVSDEFKQKIGFGLATGKTAEPDQAEDSKLVESLRLKGWQLFSAGKSRAAELAFEECLKLDPENESARNGIGFCFLNQGKHEKAIEIFQELVALNPEHGGYVNGLGRCYEAQGLDEKAVETWKTVVVEGRVTASMAGLARTLYKLKRYDEALPYLKVMKKEMPGELIDKMIKTCEEHSESK